MLFICLLAFLEICLLLLLYLTQNTDCSTDTVRGQQVGPLCSWQCVMSSCWYTRHGCTAAGHTLMKSCLDGTIHFSTVLLCPFPTLPTKVSKASWCWYSCTCAEYCNASSNLLMIIFTKWHIQTVLFWLSCCKQQQQQNWFCSYPQIKIRYSCRTKSQNLALPTLFALSL